MNGDRYIEIISAFNNDTYMPVGFVIEGTTMYFRDTERDASVFETGRHKMYRLDISSEDPPPEDILTGVPCNGDFEIVDFSVGGSFLYFTGVQGTSLVGGKVNLNTKEYTEFDKSYRLSNIEVY